MPLTRLPSLSAIRAFEAAARRGSFKEAAQELHVTPGAISQQIKALEADLGVPLFERHTRMVHLTTAGQELQPTISDAFLQIRQAFDRARPTKAKQIRINSSGAIISKWLLPRLHKFTSQNLKIQVHIETEAELNTMQNNGPDIVIGLTKDQPNDLYAEPFHRELLMPVAAPFFLEQHNITTQEDMLNAPILHDTSLTAMGMEPGWSCWGAAAGMGNLNDQPNLITFERHAADQVVDAAAAGSGIALGRSLLVYSALADGRLTSPFGPIIDSGLTYYLCCREERKEEPLIKLFFAWAKEEAAVLSTLNALRTPAW